MGKCVKDGMPYDCDKLDEEADRGNVQAEVYRGAMLIRRVTLGAGDIIRSGGQVAVNLPDIYYDVMHDFGDGNGVQPFPHIQAGGVYFVQVAASGTSQQQAPPRIPQSDGDYDLLKETNKANPGVFGVLLTNEGIRVYNEDKDICDFKVAWKPRSSSGSGVLPNH